MTTAPGYATDFADRYDEWFTPTTATTDATVALLSRLTGSAPPGPVLELGVGTGRVALPLAARGHQVHGIDAAKTMVEQLRAKPGGEQLTIRIGDFAEVEQEEEFALVYVANGSFFELASQQDQLRCFARVARRLRPGGLFVLDAHLPEALAASAAAGAQPVTSANGAPVLRTRRIHPAAQRYVSDYLVLDEGLFRHVRVAFRYAAPGELDLMAVAAGLRLRERFGGWSGAPFDDTSTWHVSVYELPA
ncbi:class I SAM-dependent methyltransferase [Kitasatospora sp. NBC_01287]|uniref:class I SAM-dependent DNA methyltransferase n=1 Tax=Kitasatospora sp. NBC_01287 TaxID=2903573 RepID=UPI00224F18B5|nr:class I SAM-dependent methyltransferase [Kitasatospora sp. NBC_01287]MCX4750375.1 class I SAM-dependent methyltransferase [Kitasatospora sp. NBC_01287]